MALREAHPQPFALWEAAMAAGHVGGDPDRFDEDERFGFQIDLAIESFPTLLLDVGAVLLDCMASHLLRVIPRRMRKRCNSATETIKPISASPARNSSSDMSLRASQMARMLPHALPPGASAYRSPMTSGQNRPSRSPAPPSGSPSKTQRQTGAPQCGSSARHQPQLEGRERESIKRG